MICLFVKQNLVKRFVWSRNSPKQSGYPQKFPELIAHFAASTSAAGDLPVFRSNPPAAAAVRMFGPDL